MIKTHHAFSLLVLAIICCSVGRAQGGDSFKQSDDASRTKVLLEHVGKRVEQYHAEISNIAFSEAIRQQELRSDATAKRKPKEFVYETIVISQGPRPTSQPAPVMTRTLTVIDGKPVKTQALPRRSSCYDTNPQPVYQDHLNMLLPGNQTRFLFAYEGEENLLGHKAAIIAFSQPPAAEPAQLIKKGGCFFLSRALLQKGRVWVDLATYDVLQIQWQLAEPFHGKLGAGVRRVGVFAVFQPSREISHEKSETLVRFSRVAFQDPKQELLLPVASESTWLWRGGSVAGMKTTTEYSRYRRFRTSVEIKDPIENER